MRLLLPCMQCFAETGKPDNILYFAEVTDDGIYHLDCKEGHITSTFLQEEKFATLYELAANAIVDGYYREAVVSFSSALESFYEFYLKVIALKRNIPQIVFDDLWKRIAAQSERQLGAYVFTYTLEQQVPPPCLPPEDVKFRNNVVHRGRIPTRSEAERYGQRVLDLIIPVLIELRKQDGKHIQSVIVARLGEMRKKIPACQKYSTMGIAAFTISITRALSEPQPTLVETLSRMDRERSRRTI